MNKFKSKIRGAKNFTLGFLTCAIIFSLVMTVTAATTRTATLIYDGVKVNIDGKETVLTDLDGNAVEPVMIDNMLYVPMSPMARAFGKTSVYEGGNTKTIFIKTPVYTADSTADGIKLSDMKADGTNSFRYDKEVMANSGNYVYDCLTSGGAGSAKIYNDYQLNKQYKNISGTIFVNWASRSSSSTVIIKFYGDGNLIYTSKTFAGETELTKFDVNLDGVNTLKIEIQRIGGQIGSNHITAGFTEATLYKYK